MAEPDGKIGCISLGVARSGVLFNWVDICVLFRFSVFSTLLQRGNIGLSRKLLFYSESFTHYGYAHSFIKVITRYVAYYAQNLLNLVSFHSMEDIA